MEEKEEEKKQKGGRKKLSSEEVRKHKIAIHLTTKEYDFVKKYRLEQGIKKTLSEEIRSVFLEKVAGKIEEFEHPKEVRIREGLELARKEIFKVGVNLNQIAHRVNTYKEMIENRVFLDEISKDTKNVFEILKSIGKTIEKW